MRVFKIQLSHNYLNFQCIIIESPGLQLIGFVYHSILVSTLYNVKLYTYHNDVSIDVV